MNCLEQREVRRVVMKDLPDDMFVALKDALLEHTGLQEEEVTEMISAAAAAAKMVKDVDSAESAGTDDDVPAVVGEPSQEVSA
jgi:hypothetical protein